MIGMTSSLTLITSKFCRYFNSFLDNISKKGLINHVEEWWNEKEDFKHNQPKNKIVEKPSSSFFDNYLSIGKAQIESGKQGAIKLENALKIKNWLD